VNVRQYARLKQRPIGPLRKLIRAVLHALGVPVTPFQVNEVALRLYRPTINARTHNYAAAVRYLIDLDVPRAVIPTPRDYPLQAVTTSIAKVVDEIRIVGEPITRATRADTRVIEEARKAIEAPIIRQALEPAREVVAELGEDEEKPRYGWARVLVGPYSCSFCAMLASRGAVYSSKTHALRGESMQLYHTPYVNKNGKEVGGFCDCEAVIVYRGRQWEGQAAAKALGELWKDRSGDRNAQGRRDPRNAFRRAWEKKIRDGDDMSAFLPESLQPKAGAA
jgi:hypothetical protein